MLRIQNINTNNNNNNNKDKKIKKKRREIENIQLQQLWIEILYRCHYVSYNL